VEEFDRWIERAVARCLKRWRGRMNYQRARSAFSTFRKLQLIGFGLIISQEISLTHQRARLALRTLFAGGAVPWSFKLQI
jgi:hypothetical protein